LAAAIIRPAIAIVLEAMRCYTRRTPAAADHASQLLA
jgi:hypothetical protein